MCRVHGRIPCHVRHKQHQRVDRVRVTAPRVGDDVVHHAVNRERVFPRERLVDTHRFAFVINKQVIGLGRPTQAHAVQRRVGSYRQRRVRRLGARWNRAREWSLVAKAARSVDGAEQGHQNGQRAGRVKAVGMGGQTAHSVEGDRISGHAVVLLAPTVGPRDRQLNLLVACGDAHLMCQATNRLGRDAGNARCPFGGVFVHPLLQKLKCRLDQSTVRQRKLTQQERVAALGVRHHSPVARPIPPKFVLRIKAAFFLWHFGAHKHAKFVVHVVHVDQLA